MDQATPSPRDKEVLNVLMNLETCHSIEHTLGIGKSAVKHHVSRIARVMGIDEKRYHLRPRIVYLEAVKCGLICGSERP
jgi:DNA-binding NarL/FixJ family response regulator